MSNVKRFKSGFGLKEQLVRTSLATRFIGAARHRRRLSKVAKPENK